MRVLKSPIQSIARQSPTGGDAPLDTLDITDG